MQDLLKKATSLLKPLGYQKKRSSFWKITDGVYTLVDFQLGSHGSYFFVNLGVHPVGLPSLLTDQLVIRETPKEYECIVRQRIEEAVLSPMTEQFREGLVFFNDEVAVTETLHCVATDGVQWLSRWGTLSQLAHVSGDEVVGMLTVVPLLWQKALWMLKCYCSAKIGEMDRSREYFSRFASIQVKDWNFTLVENHLANIVDGQ